MIKKKRDAKTTSKKDTPLSPSFPMEPSNEHIKKVFEPFFLKLSKETSPNRMSVGGVGTSKDKYCLYDPHNYRLYFDFNKDSFKPVVTSAFKRTEVNKTADLGCISHRIVNSKEHEYSNVLGCRIVVKQTQVEVTAKRTQWHKIRMTSLTHIREQFISIVQQRDSECRKALREFIKLFGGHSEFKILNAWCENKIMWEDSIDKMPRRMKWHGPLTKKEYNEKNVEFDSPIDACNYIENRALERVAPEIQDSLNSMAKFMAAQSKNIEALTEQINIHIPALQQIGVNAEKLGHNTDRLANAVHTLRKDFRGGRGTGVLQQPAAPPQTHCQRCGSKLTWKEYQKYCKQCRRYHYEHTRI